jgi:hypothetical protein
VFAAFVPVASSALPMTMLPLKSSAELIGPSVEVARRGPSRAIYTKRIAAREPARSVLLLSSPGTRPGVRPVSITVAEAGVAGTYPCPPAQPLAANATMAALIKNFAYMRKLIKRLVVRSARTFERVLT